MLTFLTKKEREITLFKFKIIQNVTIGLERMKKPKKKIHFAKEGINNNCIVSFYPDEEKNLTSVLRNKFNSSAVT